MKVKPLPRLLQGVEYTSSTGRGFELIDYDAYKVHSRFIEKIEREEIVIDPFGNETRFPSLSYNSFEFVVYNVQKRYVYALFNPPRSVKSFSMLLGGYCRWLYFKGCEAACD